jgi:hypothetical protein
MEITRSEGQNIALNVRTCEVTGSEGSEQVTEGTLTGEASALVPSERLK